MVSSRSAEFQAGQWTAHDHQALQDRMIQDEKDYYRRDDEFDPKDDD